MANWARVRRLLILLLFLCRAAWADSPQETVDAVVAQFMQAHQSAAVGVGIVANHQVVFLHSYGAVSNGQPMDLASLSKSLTAILAVRYVEKGKLELDAPVSRYLPEVQLPPAVTVKSLLSHTSGLPHYGEDFPSSGFTLANFKTDALAHAPGKGFLYSSPGYMLLSNVLEKVDSRPFLQQINEEVAAPSGAPPLKLLPGDAWLLGAGALMASPESMTRIAAALLSGKLLSPAGYELLWTPVAVDEGMALGFFIDEGPPVRVMHSGSHPEDGVSTRWVLYPESGDGLVLFSVNESDADVSELSSAIIQALK